MLFHVFLSFLHDANLLGDGVVEPGLVRESLRSCLAVVDGVTAEVGAQAAMLNLMVSNGSQIVAVRRADAPMSLRVLNSKSRRRSDHRRRPAAPAQDPGASSRTHFTLAARGDFDDAPPNGRWRPVPERALVTLSRDEDPRIEAL